MKRILWSIEVPKQLNDDLDAYINSSKSYYRTKSELIRDAVRIHLIGLQRSEVEKGEVEG